MPYSVNMRDIILIAHNLRSTHNVGSLFRTAEGLGLKKLYLTGYTPYPQARDDVRLPHLARKAESAIAKTALGAEKFLEWQHVTEINELVIELKQHGYKILALEQSDSSLPLPEYEASDKVALIVGREVEGIEPEILKLCDHVLEIPMFGKKESFNVVQAAAMALFYLRFK